MKTILISSLLCLSMLLSGCRRDQPPRISIVCTLDGHGGGDCVTSEGERRYMAPSEMVNMWATTQDDQANFAAWCYKVPKATAEARMEVIKQNIHGGPKAGDNIVDVPIAVESPQRSE